jgi:hypothetical protein
MGAGTISARLIGGACVQFGDFSSQYFGTRYDRGASTWSWWWLEMAVWLQAQKAHVWSVVGSVEVQTC